MNDAGGAGVSASAKSSFKILFSSNVVLIGEGGRWWAGLGVKEQSSAYSINQ